MEATGSDDVNSEVSGDSNGSAVGGQTTARANNDERFRNRNRKRSLTSTSPCQDVNRDKIAGDVDGDDDGESNPLALPAELRHVDFSRPISWGKHFPYPLPKNYDCERDDADAHAHAHANGVLRSPLLPLVPPGTPSVFVDASPALCFHIHAACGRARAGTIHFAPVHHGQEVLHRPSVPTPRFMPVGTKAALKAVIPSEVDGQGPLLSFDENNTMPSVPIMLANTYHLAIQPGTDLVRKLGGVHNFMGQTAKVDNGGDGSKIRLRTNVLTDSGGFQMVSLAALSNVTEDGVTFTNPYQTDKDDLLLLRPEDSLRHQHDIGADIIMALDDVVSSVAVDDQRFRTATHRTLRWYDRCLAEHYGLVGTGEGDDKQRKDYHLAQNLFPIVQGALDVTDGGLRDQCLAGFRLRDKSYTNPHDVTVILNDASSRKELVTIGTIDGVPTLAPVRHHVPGFAIGGLAGGEDKDEFWRSVDRCCQALPDAKPRYLMGVGYPLDLVVCTALGVDMYDCVYPTRTARFGVALVSAPGGVLKLKSQACVLDERIIQEGCRCPACHWGVSRARLCALLKGDTQTTLAVQLLTQHNVCYMMTLVADMHQAIMEDKYPDYVRSFVRAHFGAEMVPQWIREAMQAAGIVLER